MSFPKSVDPSQKNTFVFLPLKRFFKACCLRKCSTSLFCDGTSELKTVMESKLTGQWNDEDGACPRGPKKIERTVLFFCNLITQFVHCNGSKYFSKPIELSCCPWLNRIFDGELYSSTTAFILPDLFIPYVPKVSGERSLLAQPTKHPSFYCSPLASLFLPNFLTTLNRKNTFSPFLPHVST